MLQTSSFRMWTTVIGLSMSVLFPMAAQANCGLQSCPRPAHESDASTWQVELRTRWVAFDTDTVSGSYAVLSPRLFWRPFSRWTVGVEVPVTRLDAGSELHTGLSNPLLSVLYARRLSDVWSGEAGMQLELPLGDDEHGLADDHTMILPWIGLRREVGAAWQVSGLVGFSRALEKEKTEDEADTGALAKAAVLAKTAHNGVEHGGKVVPLYVNPHGDREFQWRFGVSRAFGRSTVEGFALGQADVTNGIAHATSYVRAGVSGECALTHALGLQALAHVPVTTARRSEAELGLSLRAAW